MSMTASVPTKLKPGVKYPLGNLHSRRPGKLEEPGQPSGDITDSPIQAAT